MNEQFESIMSEKSLILLLALLFCSTELFSQMIDPEYKYSSSAISSAEDIFVEGLLRNSENELAKALNNFRANILDDPAVIMLSDIDLESGNYLISEGRLTDFIKTKHNSPFLAIAHLQRSFVSLYRKDYAKAIIYLTQTIDVSEKEFSLREDSLYINLAHTALYWKGISVAKTGNYQDASLILKRCVEKYPFGQYSDDALYALGRNSEVKMEYKLAANLYKRIYTDYPYSNSVLASRIRQADNMLILREPAEALMILESADNMDRHIFDADSIGLLYEKQTNDNNSTEKIQYLRGESYNLLANWDMALNYFNAFLETFYNSPYEDYVRLGAGWAHLNVTNYKESIEHYQVIIDKPDDDILDKLIKPMALLYKTVALKRSGDIEGAKKELQSLSIKADYPYMSLILLELGQIYYEEGNYDQARKTLERADRESMDGSVSVRILLLLGATNIELKRWDRAISNYSQAENLAKNSSPIFMPHYKWYLGEARFKQAIALINIHRSAEAIPLLVTFLGDNTKDPRKDEAVFWLAESYFRTDLLENAIKTYSNLLSEFPSTKRREEALYGLGWSYFRLKKFSQSSETFDQMIREFPKTKFGVEVLARQGDGYYLARNYRAAAISYEKAKNKDPQSEEGQYSAFQLCDALYRQGSYEAAITQSMDFVRRYPSSNYAANSLYLIGWIRFQQNKYKEAIGNFQFLINSYSQSGLVPRAYYAIGDAYYNMANYEAAMEAYKTVIETFPAHSLAPESMRGIQYCKIALGREDEAILDIDQYIQSNPDSPFAADFRFKKAEMFYTGKRYGDAISEFETLLLKNPDGEKNAEALYWMEKSYISLNDFESADRTYKKLKSKYPQSDYTPLGLLELGIMSKNMNDAQKADSLFIKLQKDFPTHETAAQAGFERAQIHFTSGDTSKAIEIYKSVADSFPSLEYGGQSRWKVAMYYRSVGMNDSSRTEFTKLALFEFDPNYAAEAYYRIGELWMLDKDFEKAAVSFEKVKENFAGYENWYSRSLINLGECYEKLEKFEDALLIYQAIMSLRPDDEYGKTAERRIKRLPKEKK